MQAKMTQICSTKYTFRPASLMVWPHWGHRARCGRLYTRGCTCHLPPGRIFSYCGRARAYTHVLARVYSTRASTCTIYTCFTLPPTRVNPTGLQLSIFQQFWSFVTNIRTSMLPNKFYGRAQPNWDNFDFDFDNCGSYFWKSWPCLICLQFIYLQTDHVMPPSLDFERE